METSAIETNKGSRNIGYAILGIITLIGLYAVFIRFRDGLIVTNLTQHVPWGFWVGFYIYFIGLSAGAFLLSSLIY
ncbi:MAG: oxidoreductase, partial [Bacteroidota bacterium]